MGSYEHDNTPNVGMQPEQRTPHSVFHTGTEEPIDLEWPSENWDETQTTWKLDEMFELGGEDMGYDPEEERYVEEGAWQAQVTLRAYMTLSDAAPYPYLVWLDTCTSYRWIYFPLLSDLLAFCALAAPVLRLNFETRPLQERGARKLEERDRRYRLRDKMRPGGRAS